MIMMNHNVQPGNKYTIEGYGDVVYISWVDDEEQVAYDNKHDDEWDTYIIEKSVLNNEWTYEGYDYSICSMETLYNEMYMLTDAIEFDTYQLRETLDEASTDDAAHGGSQWDAVMRDTSNHMKNLAEAFERLQAVYDELTNR